MLTIAMNEHNYAVTQYGEEMVFNSFAANGADTYGANSSGIYKLDQTEPVDAFFEFWIGDAGALNIKKIRAIHFGGKFGEAITATLTDDDGVSQTFPVAIEKLSGQQHGARVFIPRTQTGRYWKLRIDGRKFAIDRIDVTWNVLAGSKQNGR